MFTAVKKTCDFEAKPLTSYSSHSGTTSKMWVLPNGNCVSIPCQHYEWALANAPLLKHCFGIDLRHVLGKGDTPIRLYMLRRGCVRVNYEHKGGRLTLEAHHLHWGAPQIKGCRRIIRENLRDIFFVTIRLLNNKYRIVADEFTGLAGLDSSRFTGVCLLNAWWLKRKNCPGRLNTELSRPTA